ncbi:S-layer family protein [Candidatus Methylospira mobilis]|uniref:S-layer family protein n=1 Tax=Candidatus Methylospira mobilis TaxID=1808979 RepID=A0A5Q0BHV5_9GAMM|nr:S-layer family protein [Candidatus Methylospira mobilis]QFY41406.1 S-layer family protein [Candidatus Methylospira mobilis]
MPTYTPSYYAFPTGATAGTVTVASGFNTNYTNGPIGEVYAIGNASAAVISAPVTPATTVTGYQLLYTVSIQGLASDYTASGYYGNITLTSKSTGQVIQFKIPQPPAGANNYGVDVQFTNGSLSFTGNTSASGAWTMWMTQGGTTSNWGNSSVAVPATGTSTIDIGNYVTSTPAVLNASDTSSANFPTTYTLTTGTDTNSSLGIPSTLTNGIISGALSSGAQTLTTGDSIVVTGTGNVLNATLAGGVSPTLGTWSGVQTFNLTPNATGSVITATGVTGLTTLNFTSSALTAGQTVSVQGLATAPTTIGLSSDSAGTYLVGSTIAASTNLALNVATVGVGTAAVILNLTPYNSSTVGYTGITINSTGSTNYLQVNTGASTETSLTVTGSSSLYLQSGAVANQNNITTIDASQMTAGGLVVEGLSTITTANGGGTPATNAYLGSGSTLSTFKGGSAGTYILDLSGVTTASTVTGLTVTDLSTATNTVILNNSIVGVAGVLTANLTKFVNVQNIGVYNGTASGTASTINDAYLNGATTLKLYNDATNAFLFGNVTVNNAISGLTVDFGALLRTASGDTVAVNSAATTGASTLTLKFNGQTTNDTFNIGSTGAGESNVTLNVTGTDVLSGAITFVANSGNSETVNITGTGNLTLGAAGNAVTLTGNGTSIIDSGTGTLNIAGTGANGTNASVINAATTAGLTMGGLDTSASGVTVTGSTSVLNTIFGSAQSDNITASLVGGDIIRGGAKGDVINLNASHSAGDTLNYAVADVALGGGGVNAITITNADTINNFIGGASKDVLQVSVAFGTLTAPSSATGVAFVGSATNIGTTQYVNTVAGANGTKTVVDFTTADSNLTSGASTLLTTQAGVTQAVADLTTNTLFTTTTASNQIFLIHDASNNVAVVDVNHANAANTAIQAGEVSLLGVLVGETGTFVAGNFA